MRVLGGFDSGYASRIARFATGGELWQGGVPLSCDGAMRENLDMLVFCSEQLQPASKEEAEEFYGVRVVLAPMDDVPSGPTSAEVEFAQVAAREIVDALKQGKRVLVTCAMGWNRSGFVSALAITMLTGMSGIEAVDVVRKARPKALSNPGFVEFLEKIPSRRRG